MSKNTPTHAYSFSVGAHLLVESGLERELVEELDGDPDVTWIVAQPAELHFHVGRQVRRHIPDLLVATKSEIVLWDARPTERQSSDFLQVTGWTAAACADVGWAYRLFPGHAPTRRVNGLWLSAYRFPSVYIEAYADVIREGLRDGSIQTVGHVAQRDSGYGQLLNAMYHLLWAHRLGCDLERPITSATALSWLESP